MFGEYPCRAFDLEIIPEFGARGFLRCRVGALSEIEDASDVYLGYSPSHYGHLYTCFEEER